MGNIGKERRRFEILPAAPSAPEPERPTPATPSREPAPAK